jgi:hypothetical protein
MRGGEGPVSGDIPRGSPTSIPLLAQRVVPLTLENTAVDTGHLPWHLVGGPLLAEANTMKFGDV